MREHANRNDATAPPSNRRAPRALIVVLALALAVLIAPPGRSMAAPGDAVPVAYDQEFRPQVHYTAEKNWLNDPNGLVYYRGEYHLFYQYNPGGTQWGNMSWGHAVSRDLVQWRELPVAIPQTFDAAGKSIEDIFSGSAVVDTNNTSGFGTRKNPPLVAIYTSAYTGRHPTLANRQAQSLAYSTDGGRSFTKYAGNPVLDITSNEFRDPKVFWYAPAKEWRMVVVKAVDRKVAIYRSANLKRSTTSPTSAPPELSADGECPDLSPWPLTATPAT